jgi:SpoIIAA-like
VSGLIHHRPRQRGFAVIRPRGLQPKLDIVAIARELAQFQAGDASLKVLFDWSELDSWPFGAPSVATVRAWKETVPSISRAAIVHDPKWTRHAALLAALLRVCDAAVRSFLPSDYDGAIIWLEQKRVDKGQPYRGRGQHL